MAANAATKAVALLSFLAISGARQFPDMFDALMLPGRLDDARLHLEDLWAESYDHHWLESITKNSTLQRMLDSTSTISDPCARDLLTWVSSFMKMELWAINLFDASGKLPPGVLKGNLQWLGNYEECLSNSYAFRTHYCPVSIGSQPQYREGQPNTQLRVDLCIPKTCSSLDLTSILKNVLPASLKNMSIAWCIDEVEHITTSSLSRNAKGIIGLLSLFGVVIVAATLYDLLSSWSALRACRCDTAINSGLTAYDADDPETLATDQHYPHFNSRHDVPLILASPTPSSRCQRICGAVRKYLLAFSIRVNGLRILSMDKPPADGSTLPALHGIRFLSMSWVILGHTYVIGIYGLSNPADLLDMSKRFTFQAILNATVSVDTFFVLSGTLVSYLLLRELRSRDGPLHINWLKVVVHRYWRLTPIYMILIGVVTCLFVYFGNGPLWPYVDPNGSFYDACKANWWTNLLYINNIVYPSQQCFGWAWYLANDMQLYLFSLVFIVILYLHTIIGVICATVPIIISCLTVFIITAKNHYPASTPTTVVAAAAANSTFNELQWMNDIYYPPWCRAGPYFIGVLLGFVLFRVNGRLKIHRALVIVFWCLAAVCNLSVLYGLYGAVNGYVELSNAVSSLYAAVHRTAWGIGVAWVTFACVTGNGGFINSLLSWPAFYPLSRLTYAAYLVHPLVMIWYYLNQRSLVYISSITMTWLFCGHLLLTYAVAFVISLAFEAPMIRIMKLAFGEEK